jgi:CubicO group peptidase (beta-lactamase class C family)
MGRSCGIVSSVQNFIVEATMSRFNPAFHKYSIGCVVVLALAILPSCLAQSTAPLAPGLSEKIDGIAHNVLQTTGVPSASLAVVKNGRIAYTKSYGNARIDPLTPAQPQMRYSIGSISKQFTAAAILMLAEEGNLSLDDPVSKYVSGLTRGNEVTIRELLSHTSGYQDFWPQDYVPPLMLQPITADGIMDRWARMPLDFDPGTKWQYSNTNYVIAGVIVEKVSGVPLLQFLSRHVFSPLGMKSVTDTNENKLPPTDPSGYFRYAIGPLRLAPKEGKGWMFAAGELAMTAEDLALWDISMIQETVLKPASYHEMETEVLLKNGVGTRYGLGVGVTSANGHRILEHGGEVSGFTAENIVMPDDGIAVVVLTNQDAAEAASEIGSQARAAVLESENPQDPKRDALIRKVYDGLQRGQIDRSLFTDNANAYFTDQALKDYASSLGPLGAPQSFTPARVSSRGGMTARLYDVKYADKSLVIIIYEMPDGKFEQYMIAER